MGREVNTQFVLTTHANDNVNTLLTEKCVSLCRKERETTASQLFHGSSHSYVTLSTLHAIATPPAWIFPPDCQLQVTEHQAEKHA